MSSPKISPRILVIEHEDQCPPALVGDWLAAAGCELDVVRPYAGDEVPALEGYDAFLVLGGPMGANDDERHAWLPVVKERVRTAVASDLPTLGICLGHQLIAVALGGTVGPNPLGQQVGLLGVAWTDAAASDPLLGPVATPRRGVQWNDDVVTALPDGATLLAATGRGEVQAVRYAATVWGVQVHPEVDVSVLKPWADSDKGSHEARGIDQEALLRDIDAARAELDDAWRPLADGFARLAAAPR
ncbi:type 1 glutamine amidotransferase [Nocardioides sp. LS1]|uniref:type 1 glutamine amidotransferase n=1 Tax=Nocardioides sp. LS1 TaxID=1027620 RepID=UPI000FF9DB52|nr:type 1 glutamine amidotransferase [Nocardioides sp. LS1]GCD88542.1 glutamine amidotransferase [Nocardioides sp. LS1]